MGRKKVELYSLAELKRQGRKITMLTAYDYPTAKLLDEEGIDVILVGDSVANVVLGYSDTRPVTVDEMLYHCKAVMRGVQYSLVIGDMPFMSFNLSQQDAVANAGRFIKEVGVDAVKIEGGGAMVERVASVVQAGIPVCGHLGLTPQTASLLGGYRVQGKMAAQAATLVEDAIALQDAGVFMLVLELVPARLAGLIARKLEIPVIGIGAGVDCDGQVLVVHDMLGINPAFTPKFLRRYADLDGVIREAVQTYRSEVVSEEYPLEDHSFTMADEEFDHLLTLLGEAPSVDGDSD